MHLPQVISIWRLRRAHHLCDHAVAEAVTKASPSPKTPRGVSVNTMVRCSLPMPNGVANRPAFRIQVPTSTYRQLNDVLNSISSQYLWHHRQGLHCSLEPRIISFEEGMNATFSIRKKSVF